VVEPARVVQAFSEAAHRLAFSFTTPYLYETSEGIRLTVLGLVHHYGGPVGTMLLLEHMSRPNTAELKSKGLSLSVLGETYAAYEEALFKATLNDWQYFGPVESRPHWYTGEPW
jgi:hypothetical protein